MQCKLLLDEHVLFASEVVGEVFEVTDKAVCPEDLALVLLEHTEALEAAAASICFHINVYIEEKDPEKALIMLALLPKSYDLWPTLLRGFDLLNIDGQQLFVSSRAPALSRRPWCVCRSNDLPAFPWHLQLSGMIQLRMESAAHDEVLSVLFKNRWDPIVSLSSPPGSWRRRMPLQCPVVLLPLFRLQLELLLSSGLLPKGAISPAQAIETLPRMTLCLEYGYVSPEDAYVAVLASRRSTGQVRDSEQASSEAHSFPCLRRSAAGSSRRRIPSQGLFLLDRGLDFAALRQELDAYVAALVSRADVEEAKFALAFQIATPRQIVGLVLDGPTRVQDHAIAIYMFEQARDPTHDWTDRDILLISPTLRRALLSRASRARCWPG